ncbi:hypothetical protein KQX54_014252 [Cotesia glomerata]|uniref:Uncharacterized protein n=1 Tax=Cotesia glomerata TaxID=32391 RepID=A0AAV7IQP8_COTGL|nr:hypothetical protein KQX54_014252 [Cotesia glomerata]
MTNHMVIDFNGCVLSNSFRIKEYAMCKFNSETGEKSGNTFHEISQPFLIYRDVNNEGQKNYEIYFKQHGIEYDTFTKPDIELIQELLQQASKVNYIFVRNKKQEVILKNLIDTLGLNNNNTFFSLDIFGLLFEPRESTTCPHHKHPYKNNCAKDNLEIMFRWLIESKLYLDDYRKKMHMVVDFNAYFVPHGTQRIKEFSCQQLDEKGAYTGYGSKIIKPSITLIKGLPEEMWQSYLEYFDVFGIEWEQGNCDYYDSHKIIKNYFEYVTYVYVKDSKKKKFLMNYIGDLCQSERKLEILCLDDYGYDKDMRKGTARIDHHKNPERSNCAVDNTTAMRKWLVESQLFKIEEYAYYKFDSTNGRKSNQEEQETGENPDAPIHKVGIPSINEVSQVPSSFDDYFQQYGVELREGNQTIDVIQNRFKTITESKIPIFLRNKNQKKRFQKFIMDYEEELEKILICLDDLGFLFEPKQSTFCKYHKYSYRNNCAKDNLEIMYNWLIESNLYKINRRTNMNMVVDFSVHYMPFRTFTIKEFVCYKLGINPADPKDVRIPIEILIKSPEIKDPDLEEFYEMSCKKYLYYNGTNEANASLKFCDAQKTLKALFLDATYVYVKNYNKEILLTNFINDLYACNCNLQIIHLDEFGYGEKTESFGNCQNHIQVRSDGQVGKIYCARENATVMLNWLKEKKMFLAENRNRHFNDILNFVPKKKVRNYKYETEDDDTEKERLEIIKMQSSQSSERMDVPS